jgi:hypothetical protein
VIIIGHQIWSHYLIHMPSLFLRAPHLWHPGLRDGLAFMTVWHVSECPLDHCVAERGGVYPGLLKARDRWAPELRIYSFHTYLLKQMLVPFSWPVCQTNAEHDPLMLNFNDFHIPKQDTRVSCPMSKTDPFLPDFAVAHKYPLWPRVKPTGPNEWEGNKQLYISL